MKKLLYSMRPNSYRNILLLSILLLIAASLRFLFIAYHGLFLFEFGDESEKYVVAKMLLEGKHLYRDIFSHHGPLLYILAHAYASFIDASQFNFARAIQIGLVFTSAISIYLSPVLISRVARIWAITIYIFMLSSVWLVQGLNMLLYHSVAGFLFVVALSQLVLPALLNYRASYFQLALSVFCMTMACFSAYVFLPAAILFFSIYLVSVFISRFDNYRHAHSYISVFAGAIIALFVVLIWLYLYADIKGYIVYHLYFNQKIYSSFLWWLSPASFLDNFIFSLAPDNFIKIAINGLLFFAYSLLSVSIFTRKKSTVWFYIKLLILIVGMYYLNPRGDETFKNGGLLVATLALLSIVFAMVMDDAFSKNKTVPAVFLLVFIGLLMIALEITARCATSSPHKLQRKDYSNSQFQVAPVLSDRYQFIRFIVKNNEPIQVLAFGFAEYLYADRMPATGQGSYLPWQAAYKRDPIPGYKMDICKDLRANLPPLIVYDGANTWDKYALPEYEPCIMEILSENYLNLDRHPEFFIRKDRFIELRMDQKRSTYLKQNCFTTLGC